MRIAIRNLRGEHAGPVSSDTGYSISEKRSYLLRLRRRTHWESKSRSTNRNYSFRTLNKITAHIVACTRIWYSAGSLFATVSPTSHLLSILQLSRYILSWRFIHVSACTHISWRSFIYILIIVNERSIEISRVPWLLTQIDMRLMSSPSIDIACKKKKKERKSKSRRTSLLFLTRCYLQRVRGMTRV